MKEKMLSSPVLIATAVFVISTALVVGVTKYYYQYNRLFLENVLVEAHGMLFDIAVLGVLVLWLNQRAEKKRQRQQNIERYKEEIEDYLDWDGQEGATYRIVGNIKRLNKLGVSKIALTNANLKGAILWSANLAGANLAGANLTGANFDSASLVGANLQIANLEKTNLALANLAGANLEFAILDGTNLLGAKHLTIDQLSEVHTLYNAKLDDHLLKEIKEKHPHLRKDPRKKTGKK